MNPTLIFSVLSALAASVWSVWTWREEQQKERQIKRDQESALFVNSLILASGRTANAALQYARRRRTGFL